MAAPENFLLAKSHISGELLKETPYLTITGVDNFTN